MEYKDYYATLEVPRTAAGAEIKKAFRRLARRYHPDVSKGQPDAEQRFKEINEAYEVLGDPQKRKAYDTLGANWAAYQQAGAQPGAQPFGDFARGSGGFPGGIRFEYHGRPEDLEGFSEFFRTFFAGDAFGGPGGRASAGQRGRATAGRTAFGGGTDFDAMLGGLGLEGLDFGGAATAAAGRQTGRPPFGSRGFGPGGHGAGRGAGGSGAGGQGMRNGSPRNAEARAEISLEEAFRGTTRLVEVDGHRYEVTVPAGVTDGQRIRLRGKAGAGAGAGDLFIVVHVTPDPIFERRGDDLVRELPLTLAEALLGAEVPVQTLTGRVLLKVPPETQNGRVFRLAGQGMPRLRRAGRGDLLVRTRVVLPERLDTATRDLARTFLDHARQPDPRAAQRGGASHSSEARTNA